MSTKESSQSKDVRDILIDAVEVELATLSAAISFWTQWINHMSKYVKTTTSNLSAIRSGNMDANQVLLEMVDTSRETMRAMTELPGKTAESFLHELDEFNRERRATKKPAAKRRARVKA